MNDQMTAIAAIVQNPKDELETLKKISGWVFENGAILTCPTCQYTTQKTAEEMTPYLKKWPRCSGPKSKPHKTVLVSVR